MAAGASELMRHDISPDEMQIWAARTADGMALVELDELSDDSGAGADLVTLRNGAGDVIAARLIGPVTGGVPVADRWRVENRWRIDATGEPFSSVAPGMAQRAAAAGGHDWGALGLPDGPSTRIRPIDDPVEVDERHLAHRSHGHRYGQQSWWLTVAPGDHVWTGGLEATVIATDRRRRMLEIETEGELRTVPFDDVSIQETTA